MDASLVGWSVGLSWLVRSLKMVCCCWWWWSVSMMYVCVCAHLFTGKKAVFYNSFSPTLFNEASTLSIIILDASSSSSFIFSAFQVKFKIYFQCVICVRYFAIFRLTLHPGRIRFAFFSWLVQTIVCHQDLSDLVSVGLVTHGCYRWLSAVQSTFYVWFTCFGVGSFAFVSIYKIRNPYFNKVCMYNDVCLYSHNIVLYSDNVYLLTDNIHLYTAVFVRWQCFCL